jgi:hypothetical protein
VTWALVFKLIHVLIAIALVAGIVGRGILLRRARRAERVDDARLLADAAGPFEQMAIQGSTFILPAGLLTAWAEGYDFAGLTTGWILAATIILLSTVPLVVLVFIPRGRNFDRAMEAALQRGSWTDELRAAFDDRAVALARWYEILGIAVILALMVLKPF